MNGKRKLLLTIAVLLAVAAIFHLLNDETVAGKGGGKGKPPAGPPAISFAEHVPGRAIKTIGLQGEGERTLVCGPDVIGTEARWSPDGTRLGGYVMVTGEGKLDYALMSIKADGSDEQILARSSKSWGFTDWNPTVPTP